MNSRKGVGLAALAVGLVLLWPVEASASQTIGQTGAGGGSCTNRAFVQRDLTSGPSYSPSSYGVITSWRAHAIGVAGQTLQLAVFRKNSTTSYTILRRDVVRTLTNLNAVNTFAGLRLPIEPGELIGVYTPPGSTAECENSASSGDNVAFSDPPGDPPDNMPGDYSLADLNFRVNAQAVVEPDKDRDVFGDESQDDCVGTAGSFNGCPSSLTLKKAKQNDSLPKLKVKANVPGAGTLKAGDAKDRSLLSASVAKKKKPLLKAVTRTLTKKKSQDVALTLKLTKAATKRLAAKGKLKVKVRVVYTPTGGPSASQTAKVKLRTSLRPG